MAESYARFRPPVHQSVCKRLMGRISPNARLRNALDAGCGAGASTAALLPYVDHLTGLDPYPGMLRRAAAAIGSARFIQGRLESLPFESSSFQLVAAAGVINYADIQSALKEVHRVLKLGGWFAAYDFHAGSRLSVDSRLPEAHAEFRSKYPASPGYAVDLASLPFAEAGLTRVEHEAFDVGISMTADGYVRYVLGDSGVESAITAGAQECEIRQFCDQLFSPIFGGSAQRVIFEAELVVSRKQAEGQAPDDALHGTA